MGAMGSISKLFLSLFISLGLVTNVFAGETKIFPQQGILNFLGMDDTTSQPIVKDGRAADIQNVDIGLSGEASRRYGYSKYVLLDTNDTDDNFEAVTGVYELYASDGTRTKLAVCGDKIFAIGDDTKTDITTGVIITEGQDNQFTWATALDKAIGTNDEDIPIQTNGGGTTVVDFTGLTNSISQARCVVWWKNYLIFGNTVEGGTTHTTRIRWSNVGTIDTWSDEDFVDIATQGGQVIEGFGILYDNLYIFLTDSIYKVSLVGGDELIVVTKVSEEVGCIAKNSIKNIQLGDSNDGLIFLSRDSTINYLDGVRANEVSTLISGVMDDLAPDRLPYAVAANDRFGAHYYLAVTDDTDTVDNTGNNLLLDYYYSIGEWMKHIQVDANAMGIANDANNTPQVYFGNYDSFVYQLNDTTKNDDVAGGFGIFDGDSIIDTATASGLTVLYDNDLSDNTVLLSHYEGTNGSNTIVEETGKGSTPYGDVQIDTDQFKFGSASLQLDGVGSYISFVDDNDFNLSNSDYTVDKWVMFKTLPTEFKSYYLITQWDTGTDERGWAFHVYNNAGTYELTFSFTTDGTAGTNDSASGTITPSVDTWYHFEAARDGNNLRLFDTGTQKGSTKDMTGITIHDSSSALVVGDYLSSGSGGGESVDGWIDESHISNGSALHTANFTAPVSAYDNSSIISRFEGATLSIISGTGQGEERVICDTTATGLVVTASSTATLNSEYRIGQIDAFTTTKWYDCGNPSRRKNFKELFLWLTKKSTPTMDFYYATDEYSTLFSKDAEDYDADSLWGSMIVSGSTVAWQGEELTWLKVPLNVSGRFLKMKFEEDNFDETMNLIGYSIAYEDLDIF